MPRRRFGQRRVILSEFLALPDNDLVQQKRLPLGITLIT